MFTSPGYAKLIIISLYIYIYTQNFNSKLTLEVQIFSGPCYKSVRQHQTQRDRLAMYCGRVSHFLLQLVSVSSVGYRDCLLDYH